MNKHLAVPVSPPISAPPLPHVPGQGAPAAGADLHSITQSPPYGTATTFFVLRSNNKASVSSPSHTVTRDTHACTYRYPRIINTNHAVVMGKSKYLFHLTHTSIGQYHCHQSPITFFSFLNIQVSLHATPSKCKGKGKRGFV